VKGEQTELELSSVYEDAKQDREIRRRWRWVEPSVWTDRMLAALEKGVKGTTLLSWCCSHFRQPGNLRLHAWRSQYILSGVIFM